jgi:DNA-directed RNA polymerase specialized sigma24 family protein
MKFFGGLSEREIAQVLGISLATVERDWRTARIWLRREMARSTLP